MKTILLNGEPYKIEREGAKVKGKWCHAFWKGEQFLGFYNAYTYKDAVNEFIATQRKYGTLLHVDKEVHI